jgi:hypothetical protein
MRAREVVACARDAFEARGAPSVMGGGQGSVFGSEECVSPLASGHVVQGTGGRARRADDVLTGRWSGTPRPECPRSAECETPAQLESIMRGFVDDYNGSRPHQSPGYETPPSRYFGGMAQAA